MQIAGMALILVGLLFFTNVLAFVTVVIDNSPPSLVSAYPADGSTWDTAYYVEATLEDPSSGVDWVMTGCQNLDTGATIWAAKNMTLLSGTINSGTWRYEHTSTLSAGKYKWSIVAYDKAGNYLTKEFQFTVYPGFQGKWYVNNVEITSPTQKVYTKDTTVNFKFVKTVGVDDSKIKCWVEEGGTKILDLTLTAAGTWTGSKTLSAGTHNLALKANDGTTTITMSIINLQIGEEWTPPPLPPIGVNQLLGAALIVVGAVLAFKKRW